MKTNELIRKRREDLHLTLEQIGNYVGVGKSTVKKWESGFISNLRRDKLAKLAEILQISPLELIYDEIPYNDRLELSLTEQQLIINYRKSDNLDKEMVHRILHIEEKENTITTTA